MNHEQRFDRQVDSTMRELIVLLLQNRIRLTPEIIERVREIVVNGMHEAGSFAVARDNDRRRHTVIPGPWDDEPTQPERPSNRPKKGDGFPHG